MLIAGLPPGTMRSNLQVVCTMPDPTARIWEPTYQLFCGKSLVYGSNPSRLYSLDEFSKAFAVHLGIET